MSRHRKKKVFTYFDNGEFIAIDGEGGERNGKHCYQLLGASYQEGIYDLDGLSSEDCLEYLIDLQINNPKGIFVIFAGGYDGNYWLKDLSKDKIQQIVAADGQYPVGWKDYEITFVQRRLFKLKSPRLKKAMTIWDVFSFFQGSFVSALNTWLPNHHLTDLIMEGKRRRVDFQAEDIDFMVKYNDAENEALVLIMDKFRDAMRDMGLKLSSWHGAGSVATAIYKTIDIKDFYPVSAPPRELNDAISCAYFGGRIEIGKFGTHHGTIHHYDINSAYPAAMSDLPDMNGGEWVNVTGQDPRDMQEVLVLSLVKFDYTKTSAFYPLPYRSEAQLKILFPDSGLGWYWKPETVAALDWDYKGVKVLECWKFVPASSRKPFDFVPKYYATRQFLVAESKRTGVPNGAEKGIKLGLNSLYGKLAQRVGYNEKTGKIPPFHNLVWAGHITSSTRSKLFLAASQKPESIICMATDGIYSTEPLELDCPKTKILGAWEYQTHAGMTMVMSGIYFLHEDDGSVSYYSRGFDKFTTQESIIECEQKIIAAWKRGDFEILLPCTRLITMKAALIGADWWERWLSWYEFKTESGELGRKLSITPAGTKRTQIFATHNRACKQMIPTEPTKNITPDILSEKHDLPWDTINTSIEDKLIAYAETLE